MLWPILVPRAHDPSGLWQGSRALAGPDFLSMRRAFVSCSRPIRFDEKSVNPGLPVLDQARALEPCHRPEGSWALGTRMALAGPDFLSMRRAFVSYSQPIRFDGQSVNRGLPVLDQARALDPCHRPDGSWALGTRMGLPLLDNCWTRPRRERSTRQIWLTR